LGIPNKVKRKTKEIVLALKKITMRKLKSLSKILILVCPSCHNYLLETDGKLRCKQCGLHFGTNKYNFIEFVLDKAVYEIDTTTEEYAKTQESCGVRVYNEYLKPLLLREPSKRVLDVGCGIGKGVSMLMEEGYDAYGIDLPSLSKFWAQAGNDPQHFFCCDATRLPFPHDFFDVVYSLGVIEHIGTENGHSTLSSNYWEARQQYANEILRVTKSAGEIIIACPNKSFPIDIQHGPRGSLNRKNRIIDYIFKTTGINIHPIWGKYHLLSYSETKRLFCHNGGARSFEPLPLKGYFGFKIFESGFLKAFVGLAKIYIDNLPIFLRSSFLNPYMLVRIRK